MFAAISPYVTYGVRVVGMLSRSGIIGPAYRSRSGGRDLRAGGQRTDSWTVLLDVLVGVVAGAHQRARGNVLEAEIVGSGLERGELLRMPVADDRQVALGRTQVLADGEDLDARLAHLA